MAAIYAASAALRVNFKHRGELVGKKLWPQLINRTCEIMLVRKEQISCVHRYEDSIGVIVIPSRHLVVQLFLLGLVKWSASCMCGYSGDFPQRHIGIELPVS